MHGARPPARHGRAERGARQRHADPRPRSQRLCGRRAPAKRRPRWPSERQYSGRVRRRRAGRFSRTRSSRSDRARLRNLWPRQSIDGRRLDMGWHQHFRCRRAGRGRLADAAARGQDRSCDCVECSARADAGRGARGRHVRGEKHRQRADRPKRHAGDAACATRRHRPARSVRSRARAQGGVPARARGRNS